MSMIRPFLIGAAAFTILTHPLPAAPASLLTPTQESEVNINNRILARVNGKPISVIDLQKKMDMVFYKQYPQYVSSSQARYRFYQSNWKAVLQDVIDKELILADAVDAKLPLNAGDIRQEMESVFGPNIIFNLDRAGITFEEAREMVRDDITIRRMLQARVNAKALRRVTPEVVKERYHEFAQKNILPAQWEYVVVTIRNPDEAKGKTAADKLHHLLNVEKVSLSELQEKAKALDIADSDTSIEISNLFSHSENDISPAFREPLAKLNDGEVSAPQGQHSRATNRLVYRIFYLQKYQPSGPVPFAEAESQLRDQLYGEAMDTETNAYIANLRQYFDVEDFGKQGRIPEGFQPFTIQ